MKTIIPKLAPIALGAIALTPGTEVAASPRALKTITGKPNVVLIVADDLGLGDLSCYGSKAIHTPCIDSLASEGLLMRHAYATSATSSPSRFALFTGLYPWREALKILPGDAPLIIQEDLPTMPKMFQDAGYKTAAVGKWHLGMGEGHTDWNQPVAPSGNTVGFDYTNLIPATVDRVPTVYVENGRVLNVDPDDPIVISYEHELPGEVHADNHPDLLKMLPHHGHRGTIVGGIPRIGHMTGGRAACWDDATMADYFLSKVKDFMVHHKEGPFFLYYGLHQPHVPRVPNERFAGKSGLGPRGDAVIEADWCVGQTLACLDSLGLLDNTLVIFTSDNGAVLQDGYQDMAEVLAAEKGHDPDNGLRGGKYSLFDAGTHIPFIVYWKGHVSPAVSDAWFCQLDLYATFAELLGVALPDGLDSEPHLDALLGQILSGGRRTQVLEAQGRLAYRRGPYVYIPRYQGPKTNETGIELGCDDHDTLWNLEKDPAQNRDLSGRKRMRLRRMKKQFLRLAGAVYQPGHESDPLQ